MKKRTKFSKSTLVPIVQDGAIASENIGEGRIIPVLIIDCSDKVELRDLIYAHSETPPGDVESVWGTPRWRVNRVYLNLKFTFPSELEITLQFDVKTQGGLVDGILHANAVYLQPTESGLKASEGINKAKIVVELPETGFLSTWEKIYTNTLIQSFRKSGLSKKEAKQASRQHKIKVRELWSHRMRRSK